MPHYKDVWTCRRPFALLGVVGRLEHGGVFRGRWQTSLARPFLSKGLFDGTGAGAHGGVAASSHWFVSPLRCEMIVLITYVPCIFVDRSVEKMAEKSCTVRTRKFMTNRLLCRRQFVRAFYI